MKRKFFLILFLLIANINIINAGILYEQALMSTNMTEKINLLIQALKENPSDYQIVYELGVAYYQINDQIKSDYYLSQTVKLKKKYIAEVEIFEEYAEKLKKTELKKDQQHQTDIDTYLLEIIEQINRHQSSNKENIEVEALDQLQYSTPLQTQQINEQIDFIPPPPLPTLEQSSKFTNMYDINKISEDELKKIKGLTDIDKAVILHYRELYGYFSSIDDLALLPGLSSKMDIIRKNFYVELNASMPVKSLTQLRSEANKSTVNINTAEITELIEKLKLNKLEAEMIIKYRERYGTFKKIENLKEVPLVGDKYEILKNKIRVE